MLNVVFGTQGYQLPLTHKFITQLITYQGTLSDVSITLLDPQDMLEVNHSFRDKDKATDVLSFPFDTNDGGEVLLCLEVIKSDALRRNVPYRVRLLHLLIHGLIHLEGRDHHEPKEAQAMLLRELQLWNWAMQTLKWPWIFNEQYEYIKQPS